MKRLILAAILLAVGAAVAQELPAPGFHHLHLNSIDPDAAIAFYTKEFPATARTTWGGLPALSSPDSVLLLSPKSNARPTPIPM